MILNMIYTVLGIYVMCIIIEYIRRLLMKKLIDDRIDNIKESSEYLKTFILGELNGTRKCKI